MAEWFKRSTVNTFYRGSKPLKALNFSYFSSFFSLLEKKRKKREKRIKNIYYKRLHYFLTILWPKVENLKFLTLHCLI